MARAGARKKRSSDEALQHVSTDTTDMPRSSQVPDPLSSPMSRLYRDPAFSDLIVKCGTAEFKLHKCIVCNRAKWFSNACKGQWKEGSEGVITLKAIDDGDELDYTCDDPVAVALMFEFIYTGEYNVSKICTDDFAFPEERNPIKRRRLDDLGSAPPQKPGPLPFHVKMYALAAKYDVESLRDTAINHILTCAVFNEDDLAVALRVAFYAIHESDSCVRDCLIEELIQGQYSRFAKIKNAILEIDAQGYGLGYELFSRQQDKIGF